MKKIVLFILLLIVLKNGNAQPAKDSAIRPVAAVFTTNKAMTDSLAGVKSKAFRDSMEKVILAKSTYPLIKSSKWSGVMPVSNIDERPDTTLHYNLLMEVTTGIKDSSEAGEINDAISEVGRLINIHIAAGIPKKNINVVVVAHGGILRSFFNDSSYMAKYHIKNPNIVLFNELLGAGVKFIACGQAMAFFNVDKKQLLPWVKVALSAQSELTSYQLKGYLLKKIETDK